MVRGRVRGVVDGINDIFFANVWLGEEINMGALSIIEKHMPFSTPSSDGI